MEPNRVGDDRQRAIGTSHRRQRSRSTGRIPWHRIPRDFRRHAVDGRGATPPTGEDTCRGKSACYGGLRSLRGLGFACQCGRHAALSSNGIRRRWGAGLAWRLGPRAPGGAYAAVAIDESLEPAMPMAARLQRVGITAAQQSPHAIARRRPPLPDERRLGFSRT